VVAESLLQRAGVVGILPTPMAAVRRAAGIRERRDVAEMPPELAARKPPRWERILGAIWFEERISYVDLSERPARIAFTDAHEAIHAACGWHEATLRLDNKDTLDGRVREIIEAEANHGAPYLIFQGHRFFERALDEPVLIDTPMNLAAEYGASRHAALHYYTQGHPDAVGLIVAGRYPRAGGLPVWNTVESEIFRERFGDLLGLFPSGGMPVRDPDTAFGDICLASRTSLKPPSKTVQLVDRDGEIHDFVAEAFFNQHCHLVFLVEQRVRKQGRSRARVLEGVKTAG
jgi:hypothetical protein